MYLKRWLLLMMIGVFIFSMGLAQALLLVLYRAGGRPEWISLLILDFLPSWLRAMIAFSLGAGAFIWGYRQLYTSFLSPLVFPYSLSELADRLHERRQLQQGLNVVAVGGGTGLPSILRALKTETSNITAVVAVADDGGSSGRLRRELGVQPPGDLRSNLVALADDEDLVARLFNYRFSSSGELDGHNFGNLFITALVGLMGSMDEAVEAAGRVLAIQGRVLPVTLTDVNLVAKVRDKKTGKLRRVEGESNIPSLEGTIERVSLEPAHATAIPQVIEALLEADLIVCGPGSLYTSILSTLLVKGIVEAIQNSHAVCIYVCNIATQPGETENFDVAKHIEVLEAHLGEGVFDVIIANDHYPEENKGKNTIYVPKAHPLHTINEKYKVVYADLTQHAYPWRHDAEKLRQVILNIDLEEIRQQRGNKRHFSERLRAKSTKAEIV
jgi:uncharacterized cofD-like protein